MLMHGGKRVGIGVVRVTRRVRAPLAKLSQDSRFPLDRALTARAFCRAAACTSPRDISRMTTLHALYTV